MSASVDTYRSINLRTANPRNTLIRAYEVAIQSLGEAEDALRNRGSFAEPLGKARTIVGGLMTSLDFRGDARVIAENLLRVYLFVLGRIQTTTIEGSDTGLAQARQALETLRDAWEEAPATATAAERPRGLHLQG
jgi:flagellin-specific chaperone FliS